MRYLKLFMLTLSLVLSSLIFAAEKPTIDYHIYQDNSTQSKVVGELKQNMTVIPIFYSKNMVKIANPKNGDVGWVNKQALSNTSIRVPIIMHHHGKNADQSSYEVITYSNNQLTPQQTEALMQRLNRQEYRMQRLMAEDFQMMQDQFNDPFFNNMSMPVLLQPIIVMPQQSKQPSKK